MQDKKKPAKRKKNISRKFIQVGRTKLEDRPLRYSDIRLDKNGWVTDPEYRPINFDMMLLKVQDRFKHVPGWWTGTNWHGLHFKPEYNVIAWKRYGTYE